MLERGLPDLLFNDLFRKAHVTKSIFVMALILFGLFRFGVQDFVEFGGHFNTELSVDLLDRVFRIVNKIVILHQDILAVGQILEVAVG